MSLPVLLTSGRKRRKTGRAYGGSTFSMSFTSFSRSVELDGSATAAIPAFPSAPVDGHVVELIHSFINKHFY